MILENVEVVLFAYANNTYLCFLSEKILSFIKKDSYPHSSPKM